MFRDPLFLGLQVRYARLAVSWDAMEHPWEQQEVDAWLDDDNFDDMGGQRVRLAARPAEKD